MTQKQGIIVAADGHAEHLLIPWWQHYQKHNHLDVAFIDLGLTLFYKEFCRARGEVISLEQHTFSSSLSTRQKAWFRKPQACLASPFDKTLWIDVDCQVRGDLSHLLSLSKHEMSLCIDWIATLERAIRKEDDPSPSRETLIFNSGLILFSKGCPIILEWAHECQSLEAKYVGDQDALSFVIQKKGVPVTLLPPEANWLVGLGENKNALITHWHGQRGKEHFLQLSEDASTLN
jgi:hypothetical protein